MTIRIRRRNKPSSRESVNRRCAFGPTGRWEIGGSRLMLGSASTFLPLVDRVQKHSSQNLVFEETDFSEQPVVGHLFPPAARRITASSLASARESSPAIRPARMT